MQIESGLSVYCHIEYIFTKKRKAEFSLNFLQFIHEILFRIGYNGK